MSRSMRDIIKKKAKRQSGVQMSSKVVRPIPKEKVMIVNRFLEPMINDNKHDRVVSEEAVAGFIFGGMG